MKKLTIAQRLILGFGLLLVLNITAATLSVLRLRGIRQEIDDIAKDALPGLQVVNHLQRDVLMYRIYVNRHVLSTDAAEKQAVDTKCDEIAQSVLKQIQDYHAYVKGAEEEALFVKIEPALNAYRTVAKRIRALSRESKDAEAIALLKGEGATAYAAFDATVSAVTAFNDKTAMENATLIATDADHGFTVTLVLSGISLAGALVAAFFITRSINRTLQSMAGTLDDASAQVSAAAGQVSAASQSLAEGSSEQAASLEETSASLEEMSSMTRRNTESAQQAKTLSGQTRGAADQGSQQMEAMRVAMDDIKASSDEVAKIVKTIDEIAFQTNILALNAAVEAARAGEHGAGFAVVAEEVRALAQRSATSAKETASRIDAAIQKSSEGVEISGGVVRALGEIVEKARQVDEIVGEIARASEEQNTGIGQINNAVGQMDKVTQSNASSAEETAAAAEELNAQAGTLSETIRELRQLVGGRQTRSAATPAIESVRVKSPASPTVPAKVHRAETPKLPARPKLATAAVGTSSELDQFFQNT